MKFKLIKLLFIFFFTIRNSYGVDPYHFNDLELSMLPDFCTKRQQSAQESYRLEFKGNQNMHHACKGLNYLNRAIISPKDRGQITTGINELTYVIDFQDGKGLNNTYLAFILYNRARLYIMSKDEENAINDLTKSISLNPKSPFAYAEFIEFHIKKGNKSDAETLLREGLENNPTSKRLLKLKDQLKM